MKISCIIPTKDRCHMVLEAIESVRRQLPYQVEIIVVDDGSKDNTLSEVAILFPEIKTVKLDGVGPGLARNAGVVVSSGDILMFLDSDDIWLDNHVQRLVGVLNRGFQVAYGVTHTKNEVDGPDFFIPDKGAGIEGDCFDAILRWCFLIPSSTALTRETFMAAGGFTPVSCGEDWVFFLKLAAKHHFGFTGPEPVTLRKLHQGSLCFLSDKKILLVMIDNILSILRNEPRATSAHHRHLKMLHEWTEHNLTRWTTVQDWYHSMIQENII